MQSLSGKEAIIEFYKNTFNTIELHGELKIQSIDLDHNLAIVRCEEPAEIKDLDSGLMIKSYFREIFLLKRIEQQWRIYRYMFSQKSCPSYGLILKYLIKAHMSGLLTMYVLKFLES